MRGAGSALAARAQSPAFKRLSVAGAALIVAADVCHRVISASAGPFLVRLDAELYWRIADRMAAGDWLLARPPVSYPLPLYPAYLALCRLAFREDALLAAIAGQHVMGVLTSFLVAIACRLATNSRLAWAGGYFCSALALGRIQLANASMTETLATLFVAAHCLAIVLWNRQPSLPRSVAAGVTLAAASLVRATSGLFWPLEAAVIGLRRDGTERHSRSRSVAMVGFLAGYFGLFGTNIAREWILFTESGPSPAQGILWLSAFRSGARLPLPPSEWADDVSDPQGEWRNEFVAADRLRAKGLNQVQIQGVMRRLAIDAIRAAPWVYAKAYARNWLDTWTNIEEAIPWYPRPPGSPEMESLGLRSWNEPRLYGPFEVEFRLAYRYSRVFSGAAACVSLAGAAYLVFGRQFRWAGLLLLLFMLYWASVVALAWPLFRYRAPLHPAMIVASLAAGHALLTGSRSARGNRDPENHTASEGASL